MPGIHPPPSNHRYRKLIILAHLRAKRRRVKAAKLFGILRNGLAMKGDQLGIKF